MKKNLVLFVILLMAKNITTNAQEIKAKGLTLDDAGYNAAPRKSTQTRSIYDNLPESATLKQYCPKVGSQSPYGTCTAWACGYAGQTIAWAAANGITNKEVITQHAFSPGYLYRNIEPTKDGCGGASIAKALTFLKTNGNVLYNEMADKCPPLIMPKYLDIKASDSRIYNSATLFYLEERIADRKTEPVKKSISEGFPVVFGMVCPSSFENSDRTNVWKPTEEVADWDLYGGHAMCVVGYDDNKFEGAFEIMNSWGDERWGDGGFIWIKYSDFAKFTKYAYEIQYQRIKTEEPLSASVRVVTDKGEEIGVNFTGTRGLFTTSDDNGNYRFIRSLNSGERFRVYLTSSTEQYVYILSSDNTGNIERLFPSEDGNISPYFNYKNEEVALPSEQEWIQLDNQSGTDYFIVLLSKDPIEVDQIKEEAQNLNGNFTTRIKTALGDRIAEDSEIIYEKDRAGFSTKTKTDKVLPMMFSIIHK